jgi:hypothetical protein
MARATLREVDPKSQTRRVVKITHRTPGLAACLEPTVGTPRPRVAAELCPYGRPGDRMWSRETFFAWGRWETRFSEKKKRDEWHFVDLTLDSGREYLYAADDDMGLALPSRSGGVVQYWKRPAIFMPRIASRILLEVTGVRVERLQDISRDDAQAEGAPPSHPSIDVVSRQFGYADFSRSWYAQRWEQINGAGSWAANPWVWVIGFRRIRP